MCGLNRIYSAKTRSMDLFLSCSDSEVQCSPVVVGQGVTTRGAREGISRACNSVRAGAYHCWEVGV